MGKAKRKAIGKKATRKAIGVDAKQVVLHECGYKCANPVCRNVITLDVHHMEYVSAGGGDTADNLLPLCPYCHAMHHAGHIPATSIRAWKMLLLAINEAFDRRSVDVLLALASLTRIKRLSGDGVLELAPLVGSGLVTVAEYRDTLPANNFEQAYSAELTDRGRLFVENWKSGDQQAALGSN